MCWYFVKSVLPLYPTVEKQRFGGIVLDTNQLTKLEIFV